MNIKKFNKFLEGRIEKIRNVLASKSAEYSTLDDKLYNFKRTAEIARVNPETALWGMYLKHFTSVQDIVEKLEKTGQAPPLEILQEKIGDSINYMILLEALITERISKQMPPELIKYYEELFSGLIKQKEEQ